MAAATSLAVLAAALLYLKDPRVPGFYPLCPTRAWLGVDCPGCGTLRSFHLLLHGQVVQALRYNAMTVVLVPAVAYVEMARWLRVRTRLRLPLLTLPTWSGWALVAALAVFTVARNLPGSPIAIPVSAR